MPPTLWNIPFPVQNSQRNFPLTADATLFDTSGAFKLPDEFIVGMYLPVHSGLASQSAKFFIKTINVYDTGAAIIIGYDDGSLYPEVATTWITRSSHNRNDDYRLGGIGDYRSIAGTIVIGRFDELDQQPQGSHTFTPDATRISPDAIQQITLGVSSVSVVNGNETSGPYYGDIKFVAEENMQITPTVAGGVTEIKFSAVQGEGLAEDCVCDGDTTAPCIRRINGIPSTANQDFLLLGSTCLEVSAFNNGLRITDVCSEPCCGCKELEEITEDLELLGSKAVTLENFVVSLESRVTQFDLVVLGSRLSDQGCFECE